MAALEAALVVVDHRLALAQVVLGHSGAVDSDLADHPVAAADSDLADSALVVAVVAVALEFFELAQDYIWHQDHRD